MKQRSFSRTRRWPGTCERPSSSGSATMTVLLLMVVFTALGLAMLEASALHLKINGARRFSGLLDNASENGLKRGFADLAAWLESEVRLAPVAEDRIAAMRTAPARAFPALLNEAVGAAFPRVLEETFDGLSWTSRTDCGLEEVEDRGDYLQITAAFRIESSGGLERIPSRRASFLEGAIGLLAGRLPLAAVPLYIKGDLSAGERSAFAAANGIRLARRPGQPAAPGLAASASGVLPDDAGALAAKALNIGVFRPGDLSPARLRQALGLEISAEPVPDGVYLVHNDLGLGGVFVQGDLDEVVLAVRGDTQIAVFRADADEWRLEWSPARGRTEFVSPEATAAYDLVPLPILFVNGAIAALGGGVVDPDGHVEISADPGQPSVLNGVDLTIVSAAQVTIASHLVLEGVRWQDGIPYAKGSEAQLVIYASGRDIVTGEAAECAGIAVAAGAPDDLKIQASLTAAGGGFAIEGTGKSVELLGALQAAAYNGQGNELVLFADDRIDGGGLPRNGPLTSAPFLAAYSLKPLTWKEY
jgi:Tfp pilus assembly protein PilX